MFAFLKAAVYSCGLCQTRCLDPWKQLITPPRNKIYIAIILITFLGKLLRGHPVPLKNY